jgi:hypothetical protein
VFLDKSGPFVPAASRHQINIAIQIDIESPHCLKQLGGYFPDPETKRLTQQRLQATRQ